METGDAASPTAIQPGPFQTAGEAVADPAAKHRDPSRAVRLAARTRENGMGMDGLVVKVTGQSAEWISVDLVNSKVKHGSFGSGCARDPGRRPAVGRAASMSLDG